MEKQCIVCETKFKAKRSDARFCSPKCRQKFVRNSIGQQPPEYAKEIIEKYKEPIITTATTNQDGQVALYQVHPSENEQIGKRFTELASHLKTNVEDLFVWIETNYGKPMVKAAKEQKYGIASIFEDQPKTGFSSYMEKRRNQKNGLKS